MCFKTHLFEKQNNLRKSKLIKFMLKTSQNICQWDEKTKKMKCVLHKEKENISSLFFFLQWQILYLF